MLVICLCVYIAFVLCLCVYAVFSVRSGCVCCVCDFACVSMLFFVCVAFSSHVCSLECVYVAFVSIAF